MFSIRRLIHIAHFVVHIETHQNRTGRRIKLFEAKSEAPLHDVENTELAIEDGVSGLLMELFGGTIIVNDVTVKYSLSEQERDE